MTTFAMTSVSVEPLLNSDKISLGMIGNDTLRNPPGAIVPAIVVVNCASDGSDTLSPAVEAVSVTSAPCSKIDRSTFSPDPAGVKRLSISGVSRYGSGESAKISPCENAGCVGSPVNVHAVPLGAVL